jgi:hypothetical protein
VGVLLDSPEETKICESKDRNKSDAAHAFSAAAAKSKDDDASYAPPKSDM